jgi:hypothetical protein
MKVSPIQYQLLNVFVLSSSPRLLQLGGSGFDGGPMRASLWLA